MNQIMSPNIIKITIMLQVLEGFYQNYQRTEVERTRADQTKNFVFHPGPNKSVLLSLPSLSVSSSSLSMQVNQTRTFIFHPWPSMIWEGCKKVLLNSILWSLFVWGDEHVNDYGLFQVFWLRLRCSVALCSCPRCPCKERQRSCSGKRTDKWSNF